MSSPRLGDRSLFPRLEPRAYLNHAAVSPPSEPVIEAVRRSVEAYAARGLAAGIESRHEREALRAQLGTLLGCAAHDIAFVQGTTAGVVAIARSIPFRAGERIVLFEGEFPANPTPCQLVSRDAGLVVDFVPLAHFERSTDEGLAALRSVLERGGVRVVAVSAVQFQTGLRMPLRAMAELCHAHGAELFCDAIQALGVVPLDVRDTGVDYLVAGGHKFLMGLEGAGVLYVRPEAMERLSLGLAGWTGHEHAFRFLVEGPGELRYDRPIVRRASFLEQGAVSVTGYAALAASLDLLLALGIERIHAHVNAYLDALEPQLVALGLESVRKREPARRSATLSLRLPAGYVLADVARKLGEQGVSASTPDGYLRFAPHWPNTLDEVPEVVAAVARTLAR